MDLIKIFAWVFLWLSLATAAFAGISAAPWVPSRKNQHQLLLSTIKITNGSIVYDLGCGTGTLLFASARIQPNATYIGYEISIFPYLIGKIRSLFSSNISIRFGNLFSHSLKDADFVFVFLLAKAYPRLIKKFTRELKDNCTIAVEAWPIADIEPKKTIHKKNVLPLFLYFGSQFKS